MLSSKMHAALNDQIKNELYSAYLYLSMATYYSSQNLDGFANWMKIQAQEELGHAMRIYNYIQDRDSRVELKQIDAPPVDFESPVAPFEQALEHEKWVTSKIHELYSLAIQENDYATQIFLQWFISEQVEEEASVGKVLDMLSMIGGSQYGLLMADKQLGQRAED